MSISTDGLGVAETVDRSPPGATAVNTSIDTPNSMAPVPRRSVLSGVCGCVGHRLRGFHCIPEVLASASNTEPEPNAPASLVASATVVATVALIYAGILLATAYVEAKLFNVIYSSMRPGPHRPEAHLSARRMIWLHVSNLVAILFSLGFLAPWAKVRMAHYRIRQMKAGLDPTAFADVLGRMAEHAGGGGPAVLQYVSSHPPTAKRIARFTKAR